MGYSNRGRKTAADVATRQQQIADLKDRLANYKEDLDEAMIAFIAAQFDGYSERNALLIAMQARRKPPTSTGTRRGKPADVRSARASTASRSSPRPAPPPGRLTRTATSSRAGCSSGWRTCSTSPRR